jgi:hypothetical protein
VCLLVRRKLQSGGGYVRNANNALSDVTGILRLLNEYDLMKNVVSHNKEKQSWLFVAVESVDFKLIKHSRIC